MDSLKEIRLLVLNILKEGRITVEEADRIINYVNSTENLNKDKSNVFQYPNPEAITDFAREGVSKIEKFVSGIGFNIERVAQNITQKINTKLENTSNVLQTGEKFTFESEEVISFDDTKKLMLENNWGAVKILGEDRNDISMKIEKIIWTTNKDLANERDKGLKVGSIQNEGVTQILLPTYNQETNDTINLELKIPKTLELHLSTLNGNLNIDKIENEQTKVFAKTVSGEIEVNDLKAKELEALSVSGDIVLRNINSAVYTRSTSGNIEINGEIIEESRLNTISGDIRGTVSVHNSLELTSSSGDIDIKSVKNDSCQMVDIVTNSGDIHYHGIVKNTLRTRTNSGNIKAISIVANSGIIEATSTSGDIEWMIDEDCDISFKCESKSGEIFTNLEEVEKSEGRLSGTLKEGKAKLILSSVSGDLKFHHDESKVKI